MNRLEMDEEIANLVSLLLESGRDDWKRMELLRKAFICEYSIKRMLTLELDEYVIGKGADNHSFCYRLERETDELGRILGATAFKFGVYYGRTKSDPAERYRFASHWG